MARLTTRRRKGLSRGKFALPPKRRGKNKTSKTVKGRFPIDTKARARNALARATQGVKRGTLSSSQAATIRRKVKRRFPSIKQSKRRGGRRRR